MRLSHWHRHWVPGRRAWGSAFIVRRRCHKSVPPRCAAVFRDDGWLELGSLIAELVLCTIAAMGVTHEIRSRYSVACIIRQGIPDAVPIARMSQTQFTSAVVRIFRTVVDDRKAFLSNHHEIEGQEIHSITLITSGCCRRMSLVSFTSSIVIPLVPTEGSTVSCFRSSRLNLAEGFIK